MTELMLKLRPAASRSCTISINPPPFLVSVLKPSEDVPHLGQGQKLHRMQLKTEFKDHRKSIVVGGRALRTGVLG